MRWLLLSLLAACTTATDADEVCQAMCEDLVMTCEYAAYPSHESCMQGCAYARQEGANVKAEADCVAKAECDTFAIVDCEHKFGQSSVEAE